MKVYIYITYITKSDRYFSLNGKCKNCIYNCLKCKNNITCDVCYDGYYPKNISTTHTECKKCFKNCKKCKNDTNCQECFGGYFVKNNNSCVACPSHCKVCKNEKNCTECFSFYKLSGSVCKLNPVPVALIVVGGIVIIAIILLIVFKDQLPCCKNEDEIEKLAE